MLCRSFQTFQGACPLATLYLRLVVCLGFDRFFEVWLHIGLDFDLWAWWRVIFLHSEVFALYGFFACLFARALI